MTYQAHDGIEYRENNYTLYGNPLLPFLEKNSDIQFDTNWSTAYWCGYQCYWLLKNDLLYLTKIESGNYTLEDIFNTNKPILADWYTGTLQYSIDNENPENNNIYNIHIWLKLNKGEVIEKKVIKYLKNEPILNFGKYKGKSINDLIYGKITFNPTKSIKEYIECIIEFLTNGDFNSKVQFPFFNFEEEEIDFVKEIHSRRNRIQNFITKTYIAFNSKEFYEDYYEDASKDEDSEKLSLLMEKILASDFNSSFVLKNEKTEDMSEVTENSVLINADISYLKWAIRKVNNFVISPIYLNQVFRIRKLDTFKIKRLNKTIFEYKPKIEIIQYKFPVEILNINEIKFERKHSLIFDKENNIQVLSYSDEVIKELYGYYLNESFPKREIKFKQRNNVSYEEYDSNDWLMDAAGSDDPEMMNDAYWNMD